MDILENRRKLLPLARSFKKQCLLPQIPKFNKLPTSEKKQEIKQVPKESKKVPNLALENIFNFLQKKFVTTNIISFNSSLIRLSHFQSYWSTGCSLCYVKSNFASRREMEIKEQAFGTSFLWT